MLRKARDDIPALGTTNASPLYVTEQRWMVIVTLHAIKKQQSVVV